MKESNFLRILSCVIDRRIKRRQASSTCPDSSLHLLMKLQRSLMPHFQASAWLQALRVVCRTVVASTQKRELSGSATNVTCPKSRGNFTKMPFQLNQQEVSTLTAKEGPGPLRFPLNHLANQLAATPAPFPFPLAQILVPPHP